MSSDAKKLKQLIAQRSVEITKLNEIHKVAEQALDDQQYQNNFKCRYKYVEAIYDSFDKIHNNIILIVSALEASDVDAHNKILTEFENQYFQVQSIYTRMFENKQNISDAANTSQSKQNNVKLPKLELPVFDEDSIKRFWQLEEVPDAPNLSPDDILAEKIYTNTLSRTESGRYIVSLPFKVSEPNLQEIIIFNFPRQQTYYKTTHLLMMSCQAVRLFSSAFQAQQQLLALLDKGGFTLRKWTSNRSELLSHLPPEHLQVDPLSLDLENDCTIKLLGLHWNFTEDIFSYNVIVPSKPCTKRSILSEFARIFDPLGFLVPLTMCLKLLIQHLWKSGVDWDQSPPKYVSDTWNQLNFDLSSLWHREYLHTLMQRSKWLDPSTPILINTMVLLKDEHLPPLKWSLGRVVDTHPGMDGIIRVVSVKTSKGVLKRPTILVGVILGVYRKSTLCTCLINRQYRKCNQRRPAVKIQEENHYQVSLPTHNLTVLLALTTSYSVFFVASDLRIDFILCGFERQMLSLDKRDASTDFLNYSEDGQEE
ncbi:hypothetical protein NQ318_014467 [Aromia moschata]|uniref:DUF5641 domain-containing protein n=1 Tax=Aromia moschata TaxID=1265417 RepID=A0AAV8YN90_9CUCU|nr:hypothetical protein NQ318_014467 [Aromia moschata]